MIQRHCVFVLWLVTLITVATARTEPGADASWDPASRSPGASHLASSSSSSGLGRQLRQSAFCPDGCDGSQNCIQDSTAGGLRCQKCKNNLRVSPIDGRCTCSPGRYSDDANRDVCLDCPRNFTCAGGTYTYATPPPKIPCPSGTLTQVMRAGNVRACVNPPGYYYNYDANMNPFAEPCPVDTFSTGFRKQRQCTPCPTGFTTDGLVMQTRPTACIIPAGYYLKAPGQVAACPMGEWKGGVGGAANCSRCPFGVTTGAIASREAKDCAVVEEGYYPTSLDATTGQVISTNACPQGFWCPGGRPRLDFDPRSVQQGNAGLRGLRQVVAAALALTEPTIKACPDGMWTVEVGSVSEVQCMTPPGHFTAGGKTEICPAGSWRADWAPVGAATACNACGDGVFAERSDVVIKYDPVTYAATQVFVSTAADDCYIKPGQGLMFSSLTSSWRARNCVNNEYGVSNTTFGLSPMPCKPCPQNMVTSTDRVNYPNSSSYYVTNGDNPLTGGFVDVRACVTQDGWGASGRGAQRCAMGTFNKKDSYSDCSPCDFGTTTVDVGAGVTKGDCGIAKGYGFLDNKILPCPIGTYNDRAYTAGTTQPCTACPTGSTTSAAGGDNVNSCNLCLPGRGASGGDNCAGTCGGPNNATYGPLGRAFGSECWKCMVADTGYSFSWGLDNDIFAPRTVAPLGADAPQDCLAEFGQMLDGSWYLPTTGNSAIITFNDVATFRDCIARCTATTCQYITYHYATRRCDVRQLQPIVYVGEPLIGFKGISSGDVGVNAASLRSRTQAAAMSSGQYTWYQEPKALDVGIQTPAPGAAGMRTVQDCISACDTDQTCAGVTIQLTSDVTRRATTCQFIRGDATRGTFIRSMTRMDINRLAIPPLQ